MNKQQPLQFQSLIIDCQNLVIKAYHKRFTEMLSKADDVLFKLANKAKTNVLQTTYFDMMLQLRDNKTNIERGFAAALRGGFQRFLNGELQLKQQADVVDTVDYSSLALVENDDFEESLSITKILSRATNRYTRELYALNKRLAIINGGREIGEHALPGGPKQTCDALQSAVKQIDADVKVKTILYRLFDECVMDNAGKIFEDFNRSLVEAGILPHLKYTGTWTSSANVGSSKKKPSTEKQQAPAERKQSGDRVNLTVVEENRIKEFLGLLDVYNTVQQPGGSSAKAHVATPVKHYSTDHLLSVLGGLQKQIDTAANQPSPQNIKTTLAAELAKSAIANSPNGTTQKHDIAIVDTGTIDLVGMLFDYVLQDDNLPDAVKALLSRLHTPFLRIAIADKSFLVRKQHPARMLLNAMTQYGIKCTIDSGGKCEIYEKLQSIVALILQKFDGDIALLEELHTDFTHFTDALDRRSELMEKRAVEAATGQERLRMSRQRAIAEITNRIADHELPDVVTKLLNGPWANLLVLKLLRSGDQSAEWIAATQVIDDLIWSVIPKSEASERQELSQRLPEITASLRAGMDAMGQVDIESKRIFQELANLQQKAITPPPKTTDSISETPGELQERKIDRRQTQQRAFAHEATTKEQNNIMQVSPQSEDMPTLPEDDALVKQLQQLKFGTWFDYCLGPKKQKYRLKLAWYNPNTSKYMFVNQTGMQVALKPLHDLVHDVQQGDARILTAHGTPFVDKAMDFVKRMLTARANEKKTAI